MFLQCCERSRIARHDDIPASAVILACRVLDHICFLVADRCDARGREHGPLRVAIASTLAMWTDCPRLPRREALKLPNTTWPRMHSRPHGVLAECAPRRDGTSDLCCRPGIMLRTAPKPRGINMFTSSMLHAHGSKMLLNPTSYLLHVARRVRSSYRVGSGTPVAVCVTLDGFAPRHHGPRD